MSRYEKAVTVDLARYLLGRGIDEATARTFRLGVVGDNPMPGHSRHRGKLVIPYLDKNNQPLTLRFRCIEDHDHRAYGHGKYMSLPEEPSRMFNVRAIFEAEDEIHVAEGELDAVILNSIGLPAVAIPGVQNYMPRHQKMLAGFNRVWVWADPDDAGADFANRMSRSLRAARVVGLDDGDVTETYLARGAAWLYSLVDKEYDEGSV